jgi:hypothetical protein
MMLALSLLLLAGCEEQQITTSRPQVQFAANDNSLKVIEVGYNDYGYWRVVELTYNNKKMAFLQHYDTNNQSMVQINESLAVDK